MENPTGILVALMFVTIVTMAIANLLTFLAARLRDEGWMRANGLQVTWVAILGFICLDAFWRCIDILSFEDWEFAGFLLMIAGASVLFFASSTLPEFVAGGAPPREEGKRTSNGVFFVLLASFEVWLVLLNLFFPGGSIASVLFSLAAAAVLLTMALRPGVAVYRVGTWVVIAVLAALTLVQLMGG